MASLNQNQNPQTPAIKPYVDSLVALGDKEGALREVEKALKQSPNDPQILALKQSLTPRVDTSHGLAALRKAINSWLPWKADAGLDAAGKTAENPGGGVQYASAIRFGLPNQNRSLDANMRYGDFSAGPAARAAEKEGLLKLRMGDYSEAEKFFTAKIQEYPYNWLAYRFRALARRNLKNIQGAYDDASKAIQLNPKDGRAYDVRALASIDMGRYQDSVTDTMFAANLNPRDADAWRTRALAEEKLGRTAEMLQDLKKAAELDPQYEEAYRQALQPHQESVPGVAGVIAKISAVPYLSTGLLGLFALIMTGFGWLVFQRAVITQVLSQRVPVPMSAALRVEAAAAPIGSVPSVVDHFEIVRKLGQGGMGEVFEGLDKVLERKVALKKLRDEIAHEPRERRRFIREARMVAKLQHPNIIQIYTVLERPDDIFLVFELVEGRTLDKHLIFRYGADGMGANEALGILWQVGAALDHAHSQGIIHRDLKPSNIMVKDKIVKVMDFGIARQVQEALSTMSRGEVIGTPAYMAPEQERGQALKESDLYALGVCLYEMLTNLQPFPDYDGYELKMKKAYRPLSELNAALPKGLDRFMETALNPSPEHRYHSAQELIGGFQKAAALS